MKINVFVNKITEKKWIYGSGTFEEVKSMNMQEIYQKVKKSSPPIKVISIKNKRGK